MTYDFMRPGKAAVVVGGQFGSEAKGLVAAHLASGYVPMDMALVCTTNAGAQAGHTTVLPSGKKFVCFHLPTIGVMIQASTIYLNAGSIIDLDVLHNEVALISTITGENEADLWSRIIIHPNAAVIQPKHKAEEATGSVRSIGSTQKGVGAALVSKIRREPDGVMRDHVSKVPCAVTTLNLNSLMACGYQVTVEIPQGTGLSLNASPFYPHCTSRDCWVGQGLADAGIHPSFLGRVAMVCRTFPIRVGNILDANGQCVGPSGDFYPDSTELSWDAFPGVEPERTTVTKRVRRIATWSDTQYYTSLLLNRPDYVFLTFTNYLYQISQDAANLTDCSVSLQHMIARMQTIEDKAGVTPATVFSWGPRVDQCSHYLADAIGFSRDVSKLAAE